MTHDYREITFAYNKNATRAWLARTRSWCFAVITLLTFLWMDVLSFPLISLLPDCECVSVIGCRCVLLSDWCPRVSVGCGRELIGSSLQARSLRAGSTRLSLSSQPDCRHVCLCARLKTLCCWWCLGDGKREVSSTCWARVSPMPCL